MNDNIFALESISSKNNSIQRTFMTKITSKHKISVVVHKKKSKVRDKCLNFMKPHLDHCGVTNCWRCVTYGVSVCVIINHKDTFFP